MKRKILPIALALVLVLGSMSMGFADTLVTGSVQTSFADMPDNWSTAALNKAVDNQLLMGYDEGGKKLIKANNSLTRAEMAAVVNRAFNASKTADISKATDVTSWAWYSKDMAKAVKMGTFALDSKMRPGDKITRQEAFAVLARAFKLTTDDTDNNALNAFSDKGDIAPWALKDLNGMAAAGYIQGSGGKLNPEANITRAEFAVVMDNLVKQYIDDAVTIKEVAASGNVMVRVHGVTLENVTIKGDLIIADGVGEGDLILDSVKVDGRLLTRGGGANSIIIKNSSYIGKIILSKIDGIVRVVIEGGAAVDLIYIADGSDDVVVQGNVGVIEVAEDNITATIAAGSTIKNGYISGKSSRIIVEQGAKIDKITISGTNAKVEGSGNVSQVEVLEGAGTPTVTTPGTAVKYIKEDAPSGGGGGGGDIGTEKQLYVNIDGTDYQINSLKDVLLNKSQLVTKESDIKGLFKVIAAAVADEKVRAATLTISGDGEGVFGRLESGDYSISDRAVLEGILGDILDNAKLATGTAIIENAVTTAQNITEVKVTSESNNVYKVTKVELSGGPLSESYIVWGTGAGDLSGTYGEINDKLNSKSFKDLNGLTLTVTFDKGPVKTIKLSYK